MPSADIAARLATGGATDLRLAGSPVWHGFRGGKGVATSVGQCLATFPASTPIDLGVALATAASPRWKRPASGAALPAAALASSAVILFKFATAAPPPAHQEAR